MAIKSKRNIKTVLGTSDLTLTAKPGESLLITDVKIYEPTAVYANFLIERSAVGFFRVASLLGNHLHFHPGKGEHSHNFTMGSTAIAACGNGALSEDAGGTELTNFRVSESAADDVIVRVPNVSRTPTSSQKTLLKFLFDLGIFKGYPVSEGETFTVELCTGATAVKVVEYDLYDAADLNNEMENGSRSNTYLYVNYGDSGANIQAIADVILAKSNNLAEYPDFPFGGNVPSGHKIELIGILASDVAPAANAAAACTYTQYLKFMQGREVLFDEDHNGLLYCAQFPDSIANSNMIAEGYAVGGNYTQCDRGQPLMFDPPLVFNEGEELAVFWHLAITGAGAAITQELHEVAFICKMSPMS